MLQVVCCVASLHDRLLLLKCLNVGCGGLLTRNLACAQCGTRGSWYTPCNAILALLIILVSRARLWANVPSFWLQSYLSVDVLWTDPHILTTDLRALPLFRISRFVHVLTASIGGRLINWATTVTLGHRTILRVSIDRSCSCRLHLDNFERVLVDSLLIGGVFLMLFESVHDLAEVLWH